MLQLIVESAGKTSGEDARLEQERSALVVNFGEDGNGTRSNSVSSESASNELEGEMEAERFFGEVLRIPLSVALVGEAVELDWVIALEIDKTAPSSTVEFLREDEAEKEASLSLDVLRIPLTASLRFALVTDTVDTFSSMLKDFFFKIGFKRTPSSREYVT